MKKWKQRLHAKCPHCQHEHEDLLHMATCTSQAVTEFWATHIDALENWMEQKDTDKDLQTFIIDGLTSWLQDPYGNEILITSFPPHKQQALQNQLKLGWYAFISGLIHPALIELQQHHYSNIHRKKLEHPGHHNSSNTTGNHYTTSGYHATTLSINEQSMITTESTT